MGIGLGKIGPGVVPRVRNGVQDCQTGVVQRAADWVVVAGGGAGDPLYPVEHREFLHAVTMLVARLGRPFILFAPTHKYYGSAAKEVLGNLGAAFFPLDTHLGLEPKSGQLAAMNGQTGDELFAEVVPEIQDLPEADLAGRVCVVLEGLDSGSRRKNPSLAAVFRLYFVLGLPVAQVARKCRCSVGTIVNRLKLIEAKTGATPEQLMKIAPQFEQFYGDLTEAKGEYFRNRRLKAEG